MVSVEGDSLMVTFQPGTAFLSFFAKLERPRAPPGVRHSVTFDALSPSSQRNSLLSCCRYRSIRHPLENYT